MTSVCVCSNAADISHEIEISCVPEHKAGSFRFIPSRFSLGGVLCCVFQVFDSLPRLRDFFSSERHRALNAIKYIPFCRLLLAQSEQNIDKPTIFPRSPCGVFSLHIVGELGDAAKYQRSARQREVFLHILGQK